MPDPRFYAKLDVGYFDNPKTADLVETHPRALIFHLRSILYCRQHLTDGQFPVRLVARLACATYCGGQCQGQCDVCASRIAGLVREVDERTYEVHDYLEHQDSAEDIAKRKTAGQRAAAARWGADRNAEGNAKERRGEERSSTRASGTRKKPVRAIPDDWKPTEAHAEYGRENNLDVSSEAFRFRNHAHTHDRRVVNWNAAFTNWLAKARPTEAVARGQQPEGW